MTIQRHDYLLVDDERRQIAAATPLPFAPVAFGLRLGSFLATNCYRGYWVDFKLVGIEFRIKELRLATHPADRDEVLRGKLFGREPDDFDELSVTFKDVPLPYTGKLVINQTRVSSIAHESKSEMLCFEDGLLRRSEKVDLRELPDEFTLSLTWVNYGWFLWNHTEQPEIDET